VADWEWYADYPDLVRRVTTDDLRRVAATYFVDDGLTCGLYLPKEPPAA